MCGGWFFWWKLFWGKFEKIKIKEEDNHSISQFQDDDFKDYVKKSCQLKSDMDTDDLDSNDKSGIKLESDT